MVITIPYKRKIAELAILVIAGAILTASTAIAKPAVNDSLVQKRLHRMVEHYLLEIYPREDYRFEIEFKRLPRTLDSIKPIQIGDVQKTSRGKPRGYETIKISLISDDGESMGTTHVQLLLRLWQQLPVPTERVLAGEQLSPELLNKKWVEITRMTGSFLTQVSQVEGYIADHMLPAERPLRETDLAKPSVVEAGDPVNMQFKDGGLQISLQCTARQAAAKGEEIRVYSEQTRRTYKVKVLNSNQVQWVKTL